MDLRKHVFITFNKPLYVIGENNAQYSVLPRHVYPGTNFMFARVAYIRIYFIIISSNKFNNLYFSEAFEPGYKSKTTHEINRKQSI